MERLARQEGWAEPLSILVNSQKHWELLQASTALSPSLVGCARLLWKLAPIDAEKAAE